MLLGVSTWNARTKLEARALQITGNAQTKPKVEKGGWNGEDNQGKGNEEHGGGNEKQSGSNKKQGGGN